MLARHEWSSSPRRAGATFAWSTRYTSSVIGISTLYFFESMYAACAGAEALRDRGLRREIGLRVDALRDLHAELAIAREIARAREHQIADAAHADERERIRAERDAEPRHLREAARHQCGARVRADAEPVARAGGDREDIFHRAADLHADGIEARVDAKIRGRGASSARLSRRLRPFDAQTASVGKLPATSRAKFGPEMNARRFHGALGMVSAITSLINSQRRLFEALSSR